MMAPRAKQFVRPHGVLLAGARLGVLCLVVIKFAQASQVTSTSGSSLPGDANIDLKRLTRGQQATATASSAAPASAKSNEAQQFVAATADQAVAANDQSLALAANPLLEMLAADSGALMPLGRRRLDGDANGAANNFGASDALALGDSPLPETLVAAAASRAADRSGNPYSRIVDAGESARNGGQVPRAALLAQLANSEYNRVALASALEYQRALASKQARRLAAAASASGRSGGQASVGRGSGPRAAAPQENRRRSWEGVPRGRPHAQAVRRREFVGPVASRGANSRRPAYGRQPTRQRSSAKRRAAGDFDDDDTTANAKAASASATANDYDDDDNDNDGVSSASHVLNRRADLQTAAGHHHHGHHGHYYQYVEVPKKKAWKFGFKRGNHKHEIAKHEKGHKHKFHTEFKWHAKEKCKKKSKCKSVGKMVWDYKHAKKHHHHHP